MIRNEGEDPATSLWRNPAVYIAFAAIAALVVTLIVVLTPRNPASPEQAASAQKSSLLDKVAEEPGKAAGQDGATSPAKTVAIVDKAAPAQQADPKKEAKPNPYQHVLDLAADLDKAPAPEAPTPVPSDANPSQAASAEPSRPLTPEALFAKAAPAVVKITAYTAKGERVGSGFYVSEDGMIVTNYHVVEGVPAVSIGETAERHSLGIMLTKNSGGQDGKGIPPVPVFCDPQADLAVFKEPAYPQKAKTPHLELAAVTSKPNIGARVYTIGNPHDLEKTLSDGLISGLREWENGATVIQTTVPISGGSSGGPLLDASGCVVGVIFASDKGGQNINYAVPAYKVRALIERAKTGIAKGDPGNLEQELPKSGRGGDEISRAQAALSGKDFAGALRILQRLKDSDPQNAEVWLLLAKTQFGLRNDEQAVDSANMAIALKPDYFDAYRTLSLVAFLAKRYDLALNAANAMVRLRPADCAGYSALGGALSGLSRHREAVNAHETAVKLASDDREREWNLIVLAQEYETMGRVQEAIGCLEKALVTAQWSTMVHEDLIRCYLATGNKLAAQRSYDALKKLDPQKAATISPPIAPGRR